MAQVSLPASAGIVLDLRAEALVQTVVVFLGANSGGTDIQVRVGNDHTDSSATDLCGQTAADIRGKQSVRCSAPLVGRYVHLVNLLGNGVTLEEVLVGTPTPICNRILRGGRAITDGVGTGAVTESA